MITVCSDEIDCGRVPASAQHTCPEEESYVSAFGKPMPSDTTTLRFWPSTDELSIFGASRFQSVQYSVLQRVRVYRSYGWIVHRAEHFGAGMFTSFYSFSVSGFGSERWDLANITRREENRTDAGTGTRGRLEGAALSR